MPDDPDPRWHDVKARAAKLAASPAPAPRPTPTAYRCRACDTTGLIYYERPSDLYNKPVRVVARCLCLAGQEMRGIPPITKFFSGEALKAFFPDGLPTEALIDHDDREYKRLGIPRPMRNWTLKTCPDGGIPVDMAQRWVDRPFFEQPDVMLFGKPGVGKTGLAVAMLRAMYERECYNALFVTAQDWLLAMQHAQRMEGDNAAVFQTVLDPYLLVLDDLNARRLQGGPSLADLKLSPYYADHLQHLHAKRTSAMKPTIYTMNLAIEEFRRIVPATLYDRLRQSAEWWELQGPSRRRGNVVAFSTQRTLPTE